jgi:hypothetical protein
MRNLTLPFILVLAAGILPAHAAPPHSECWRQTMQAGRRIKSIVNNTSDIRALRASPTIRREAAAALRGAVHVFHVVLSLDIRITHNPQLITQPAVTHMFCLSARALKDYESALIVDLRAGRRILARRRAGGRHDVALGSHSVGPSAAARANAQRDVNITHDVEHSNSLEGSHSVTQTRTHAQNYERDASESMDREDTLSRSYNTQVSAGATDGAQYTRQQTMLEAPGAAGPPGYSPSRSHWKEVWYLIHDDGYTRAQALTIAGGGAQEQGSPGRRWVSRWAKEHGLGGMAPPSAAQARRLVRHTHAAAAAACTSARGDAQAQAKVRAQIQQQRSAIPPAPRG